MVSWEIFAHACHLFTSERAACGPVFNPGDGKTQTAPANWQDFYTSWSETDWKNMFIKYISIQDTVFINFFRHILGCGKENTIDNLT